MAFSTKRRIVVFFTAAAPACHALSVKQAPPATGSEPFDFYWVAEPCSCEKHCRSAKLPVMPADPDRPIAYYGCDRQPTETHQECQQGDDS